MCLLLADKARTAYRVGKRREHGNSRLTHHSRDVVIIGVGGVLIQFLSRW